MHEIINPKKPYIVKFYDKKHMIVNARNEFEAHEIGYIKRALSEHVYAFITQVIDQQTGQKFMGDYIEFEDVNINVKN